MQTQTIKYSQAGMIVAILKSKKMTRMALARGMGITIQTLKKFINDPDTMTGRNRRKMAHVLGVKIEVLDAICNQKGLKAEAA